MQCRHSNRLVCLVLAVVTAGAEPAAAGRRETIAGPVEARVLKVIDGDTFLAEALVWPGQIITINVRVRGVDAPEMRSRCRAEKIAALQARDALESLLRSGHVSISAISGGKYYGRVLADVRSSEGIDVSAHLLGATLVRAYAGGRRVPFAC
ncbi:thermonuclease family protein [Nitratireductor soli]|uniref:thermonuclease family protein n=1 Tax=Nitratireductor soli TaxID=1670619 RepID=UPI00065E1F3D|nr:thermonuclease family protein [Nitratireductor soli]